eukprot:363932-Chlamydomonas_euryale.AAC.16
MAPLRQRRVRLRPEFPAGRGRRCATGGRADWEMMRRPRGRRPPSRQWKRRLHAPTLRADPNSRHQIAASQA